MKHTYTIPIRVNGISDGHHDFNFEIDPHDLGLPEQFSGTVHVRAEMDKTREQSFIAVTVHTDTVYPCDRCLQPITVPVNVKFTVLYEQTDYTAHITPEGEEARDVDPSDPAIDIGADVADVLLVNIPMRKICEEYNPENTACIESVTRVEDSAETRGDDPRWAALKNLKLED